MADGHKDPAQIEEELEEMEDELDDLLGEETLKTEEDAETE